jgi:Outer membrane protein beta-barrel domain
MKKLIICVLCFAATHSFAQFRLDLRGSFTPSNFWQTDGYGGLPTGAQTREISTFQGGLQGEYDLGYSGLTLQASVLFAENGSNIGNVQGFIDNANYTIGYSSSYLRVYSVRVPLEIVYKFDLSSSYKVFGGLGFYVAKNISGTEKGYYEAYSNSNSNIYYFDINNKVKFNNDRSSATQGVTNVTNFDFGGDIFIGVEHKRWQFRAGYDRGFVRMWHTSYVNTGNAFWDLGLSYRLFGHYRKPQAL